MTNGFDEMILNMTDTTPEPEDYTGEDGLLYCGKCHKPKEGYFPKETANGTRPFLCGELGNHERAQHWLSAMGRRWHRQELFCGLYRKCPYGA